ncbi:AAA family ATPase [Clostridium sediminicola]|uniref:AAA family ATPase n=1 Tax=Clostridium sediminicola TaxID=3114879 RepID=UPI0031F1E0C1
MRKRFNITGTCIPEKHFMIDISNKIEKIMELIEDGEYFTINRPRQFGKTTSIYMIERALENSEEYLVISTSFEGIGDLIFEKEKRFSKEFLDILADTLAFDDEELALFLQGLENEVNSFKDLSKAIAKFIKKVNKKVVLIIDEVDKSSNNQLFLSFLGMLRNKYLLAQRKKDYTFHSIILAGVHDVKSLKLRIRPGEEEKYNSPWNIASDFTVDMSFSPEEIKTMLDDYIENKGVSLDRKYFSEKLYYYTSGYPFLVSKLCKIIDERIMPVDKFVWEKEYMDMAVKEILKDSNTNFDSLIKNIENNEELYRFVEKIIIDGETISYIKTDKIINLGTIYGLLKNKENICKINNRIYEQLLYDHMMIKIIRQDRKSVMSDYNYKSFFIKEDGTLDVKKILIKFQEFMKKEYSKKRKEFLEADGRLVFLAFISPIVNGIGFAFKEVQGAEEKRFDVVITYKEKMYIIELKKWYGEVYHKRGLLQLGEYLEQYGLDEGYLLIFDFRKEKANITEVKEEVAIVNGKSKKIYEAFV